MPTLQGTVQDANGNFCQRLVRAHRRDTGALVAEGLSHPATGAFSLATADTSKHYVVVHDNDAWITYLPMLGEHNSTLFSEWGGKAVTAYGDARLSTTESKFGGSAAYFDGAGDYLSLPASADLAFGTGDFTIDAWVRLDSLGVERAIFDSRAAVSDTGLYFGIDAANHLTVFGNNSSIVTGNVALTAATWHHIALVKAGGTLTLYRDGAPVGSAASAYAITCPGPVLIGRKLGSSSNDFAGYLDEFIVRKGKAGFGVGFTLPTAPLFTAQGGDPLWHKTVLACHFDGPDGSTVFVDQAGHLLTTVGGARLTTTSPKFGTACATFDGIGDYITIPSSTDFDFGGGDFTIEFWFKSTQTNDSATFVNREWGGDYSNGWSCQLRHGTSGPLRVWATSYSLGAPLLVGTTTTHGDGMWHHFAWTRSGSTHRLFLDGNIEATAISSAGFTAAVKNITIGNDLTFGGGARAYNGQLDGLRITKAARYTANFTPPDAPFMVGMATFAQQNAMIYDHLTPV